MAETAAPAPAAHAAAPSSPAPSASATPAPAAATPDASLAPDKGTASPTPAPRKFKVKVYDQERELDEASVLTYAQKGFAADERFRQLSEKEREFTERMEKWKKDPASAIKELYGAEDHAAWLAQQVRDNYERMQETPEQKEIRQLREKWEASEREKSEAAKRAEEAEVSRHREQSMRELGEKFTAALKPLGIPEGPQAAWAVSRMAQLEEQNLAMGLNLTPEQMATIVGEDMELQTRAVFGGLEGETLLAKMGKEWVGKVVKAEVARLNAARAPKVVAPAEAAPKPRNHDGTFAPKNVSRDDLMFDQFIRKP